MIEQIASCFALGCQRVFIVNMQSEMTSIETAKTMLFAVTSPHNVDFALHLNIKTFFVIKTFELSHLMTTKECQMIY